MTSSFYAGVVVSSLKPYYGPDGNGIVRFNSEDETGGSAMFLHLVREIGNISDGLGHQKFEAKMITPQEAKSIIVEEGGSNLKPLFCVHGFFVEPGGIFAALNPKLEKFKQCKKFYPVPVLWPCKTDEYLGTPLRNYRLDQKTTSQSAGKLFKGLVDSIPNTVFPNKSLLMHSMGNHVVFNGACGEGVPDVKFDDIFMVAAVSKIICKHSLYVSLSRLNHVVHVTNNLLPTLGH